MRRKKLDRSEGTNWGRRLRCESLETRRLLTTTVPADVTGDGVLDEADYDAFVADFAGPAASGDTDLNSDGVVDLHDWKIFKESMLENIDIAAAERDAVLGEVLPGVEAGAMQIKLQDAINALNRPNRDTAAYEQAIQDVFDALFPGNLVILPTPNEGNPSDTLTQQAFADFQNALDQAIDALGQHAAQSGLGTPESEAPAMEARDMLLLMAEVVQEVGHLTGQCDPATAFGNGCAALQTNDDNFGEIDPTGIPNTGVGGLGARFVGSPFPFFAPGFRFDGGHEETIVTEALADGEMAVVLKEIRGVVAQVRPIRVPIWREPWASRRAIIGYRTVWVWEFLPAEFIKTISMTNNGGTLTTGIQQRVVIDRGLVNFWGFFGGHHKKY